MSALQTAGIGLDPAPFAAPAPGTSPRSGLVMVPIGTQAVMCDLKESPTGDQIEAFMARLDAFLDEGRTNIFIDLGNVSPEPERLRLALARWGTERKNRLRSLHVRVPSAACHYRMSITRIVLGEWLISHLDPYDFHEQLSHFFSDPDEGAIAPASGDGPC